MVELNDIIQLVGLACIVLGLIGGGIKFAGHEVKRIRGLWRNILLVILGIALVTYGPRFLETWTRFNVDSALAQWDISTGDACAGSLDYTVIIDTSGGQGTLKYRVLLDGQGVGTATEDVTAPGSHTYGHSYSTNYTASNYPSEIALEVEILEPNQKRSEAALLPLDCYETESDLMPQVNEFFESLNETVAKYGRSSSAVTHEFYGYKLRYYARTFETESDFVCYIDQCDRTPRPTPSNITSSVTKCIFEPAVVRAIDSFDEDVVILEASVDWTYGTKRGQTYTNYELSREASGQPFRITSVQQPRASERCG